MILFNKGYGAVLKFDSPVCVWGGGQFRLSENVFICVPQKKETHLGLKQHKGEQMMT